MFPCPSMVMIGAASRHVGKTEFACDLLQRAASAGLAPAGIKITTIQDGNGPCPRGGKGCGACHALAGKPYQITEETDRRSGKDTARMLQAGASRALWLRASREGLEDGARTLLAMLPAGQPLVCESNSARTTIAPGHFLVIRDADDSAVKESCRRVLHLADRQIRRQDDHWDIHPDDLSFAGGRWWWRMDATAIILAGGQSRRMGRDKGLLHFQGRPLIAQIAEQLRPHFRHLRVGTNDPERYRFVKAPLVPDRIPGQGPLMGLASCLEATPTEIAFLTGCDIPTADTRTVYAIMEALAGHDAVVPVTPDGRRHPLFAAYRRSCAPVALETVAAGRRRLEDLLAQIRVAWFELGDTCWFRNLNTPEDYTSALESLKGSPPDDRV